MQINADFLIDVSQIIWINILLSGDNALIIALACRDLPPHQKKKGMFFGAAAAVGLRILFTFLLAYILDTPFLRLVGGVLLFWIAIKLVIDDTDSHQEKIVTSDRLIKAVQTIAVADIVMSLDNVLAIAAIAKDNLVLLIGGLLISIPLIVAGSGIVMMILTRFPILVWAGAALLGWVASGMMLADPVLLNITQQERLDAIKMPASWFGLIAVLVISSIVLWSRKRRAIVNNPPEESNS